jgi:cytidylate kinase
MKATVVTFSAQLGSGGPEIARRVSELLQFRYYDREVVTRAADAAGVSPVTIAQSERWPGFFERMIESLSVTGAIADSALQFSPPQPLTMTSADYRRLIESVVAELGKQGKCVIVGHAGQVLLGQQAGVLKVLVHGSIENRAERLTHERRIDMEGAMAEIEASDHQRRDFFRHIYDVEWLDNSLYDLVLKTDVLSVESAAAVVVAAAQGD